MELVQKVKELYSELNWKLTGALMSVPILSELVMGSFVSSNSGIMKHPFDDTGDYIKTGFCMALMLGIGACISHKNAEKKKIEEALKKRVKELNGLYSLGILSEKFPNLDELMIRFVEDIIPSSMQFSDKVHVGFQLDGKEYISCHEHEPSNIKYNLTAPILIKWEKRGKLTVGYLEDLPFDKYFEPKLIKGYAERLGKIIERKEAAEQIKYLKEYKENILESSPNLVVIVKDNQIEYVNKSFASAFGGTKNNYPSKNLKEAIPAEIASFLEEMLQNPSGTKELQIQDQTYNVRPFTIGGEERIGIVMQDITELDLMRKKLIQAEKMDSIGTLAGGIAHDFNNMIGGMMGYTSLLLMSENDSTKIVSLKGIMNAAERASELTQKLLAFGRRGKNLVQAVNLNDTVNEVYSILKRSVDKSILLETDFEEKLYLIDADSSQMNQVIMNICVNASESMPNGGKLIVKTKNITVDDTFYQNYPELKSGEYIQLTFTDTGDGMTDEIMKRMFEPFFTTKTEGEIKGTGIGLASVYGIVKNHNGVIDVDSEVNQGTSFIIYLPKGQKEQKSISVIAQKFYQGKGTILIVDDEEIIREMAKESIESLGYSVITANDGKDGVKVYQERHSEIDGVILDMQMPNLSGKEAFVRMKEINPDIRALLSTGYGHNEEAQEILDLGVKDLLSKPYHLKDLSNSLKQFLE